MAEVSHNIRWNFQKIAGVLIILIAIIGGVALYIDYLIGPMDLSSTGKVTVSIPTGSTVWQIARSLDEEGLVRKPVYFVALSRVLGFDSKVKAGYYEFTKTMSLKEIMVKIVKGDVAKFKLTIPEGLTIREMAPLVAERTGIPVEEFLQAAREYKLDFAPDYDMEFQVEGFLFPDTYQLPYGITARELVKTMVKRYLSIVNTEPVQVRSRILSAWEIATIASLIEEEAKSDEDRYLISGVIYNRLDKGMYLQLCASVLYVMGIKKDRLTIADTKIKSPYNTYRNSGLTPGPISNPSLESIKAAMNPADVNYLFYFALPDGRTYYTRTYAEHLRAIKKYLD